jgi:hypothetical protein
MNKKFLYQVGNNIKVTKSDFLVYVIINIESFVAFDMTIDTYQNAQCYSSLQRRLITRYLVPYHCETLTISKAKCKAVPEESKISSRLLRANAVDFGGRGIELP